MRLVIVISALLLAGCLSRSLSTSSTRRVPLLKSDMTVVQAGQTLRKGMSQAEVGDLIGTIPLVTMRSTSYTLADGQITCRWTDGRLMDWSVSETKKTTERVGSDG